MPDKTTIFERLRDYLRQNRGRLRSAPSAQEQLQMLSELQEPAPEEGSFSLQVIEGTCMTAKPVVATDCPNALRHFLDGIQRQRILYYEGIVPVFYAYLSAVVRSRVNGRMCCLDVEDPKPLQQCDALYAPLRHVDAQGLQSHKIPVRDIEAGEPLPPHPALIQLCANRISNDRELLERELAEAWLKWLQNEHPEDWLVVDGGIGEIGQGVAHARFIGLAKTSVGVERILDPKQREVVYTLQKGERTSVFALHRPGNRSVYSWFLRLHEPAKGSLLFGLLRVEMPADNQLLSEVDKISFWLLQDRVPLSVPDVRYDRLLYPMRDCEQYLRAHAPSHAQLEALAQMI